MKYLVYIVLLACLIGCSNDVESEIPKKNILTVLDACNGNGEITKITLYTNSVTNYRFWEVKCSNKATFVYSWSIENGHWILKLR